MPNHEECNGWSNRETWALWTYVSNEKELLRLVHERAKKSTPHDLRRWLLDEHLAPHTFNGMKKSDLLLFVIQIISLYALRVNWFELHARLVEVEFDTALG